MSYTLKKVFCAEAVEADSPIAEQSRKRKGHRMALVVVVRKMTHHVQVVACAQR